jgi:hypothetical protein
MFGGRRSSKLAIPLLMMSLLIASANVACVATATSAPARGVVVNGPPPAPIAEQRSAPPSANSAWVNGYWHWEGARYVWIPGHWENAPPGAQWYAPKYSQNTDGRYYYEPGGWTAGGAPGSPPDHAPPQNASAFH